ncbi:MAG: Flavodoxin reductases (ferredoxin-NADPH reductases) family 1; Vanillate O-demethylase oxidoreductase [uncultured Friedmanniella sp.]|uniref:Flavodoxin reductases (Ferredoxin-NADPH reductases) family 1 Vanillate O-demethylase oxidoreductase n=1 Tax=uncultured Friedmanniella sp. TaxID=335381 RepID=A0A6J4JZ56_9ACTN|nr:MAG: Flavodoxin reductases (ferredoxin-NADPH reductases) family 1; Vanillate O-demethylase oxidoreductase [uncultured Friedmanniella sp.]
MSGMFSDVERDCVVAAHRPVAQDVVLLELVAQNGRDLPPWEPGSHVDLLLPGSTTDVLERQYSLCGDPADRSRYRVAVLREVDGRGGSAAVHTDLGEGAPLRIRGPRNHFPFEPPPGAPVVLVAGGIGITPFLSMAAAAEAAGRDLVLIYAGRSRRRMAFVDELVARYGDRVRVHVSDEATRLDVAATVAGLPPEAHVYACGPVGLIGAVEEAWGGRPSSQLHVEHFEAKEFGPPVWQEPFELELALTGVTVEVPLEKTVLDVVEEQGVLVVSSCRKGTCGTCETPVLEGDVEHRDSVLTPDEQAGADTMMICVSRAAGPRLVLDL